VNNFLKRDASFVLRQLTRKDHEMLWFGLRMMIIQAVGVLKDLMGVNPRAMTFYLPIVRGLAPSQP